MTFTVHAVWYMESDHFPRSIPRKVVTICESYAENVHFPTSHPRKWALSDKTPLGKRFLVQKVREIFIYTCKTYFIIYTSNKFYALSRTKKLVNFSNGSGVDPDPEVAKMI